MKKALAEAIRLLEEEVKFLKKEERDSEWGDGPNYTGGGPAGRRAKKLQRKIAELKKAL